MLLTACKMPRVDLAEHYGIHSVWTPRPSYLGQLPNDDSDYSQGIRDGCNTAISVVGSGVPGQFYDDTYFDIDKSVNNQDYYRGRVTGFNYCTYFIDPDPF